MCVHWVCECGVCVRACGCVSDPRIIQFALASCYAVHINALPIMEVYIERSNMQVELIRFRKKYRLCLRLRNEECNGISLTEPNSRELQLPDSVYCHSTEYNRIEWDVCLV